MKKRIVSFLLTVCIVLSLMPAVVVSAAGTTKTINCDTFTITITNVYAIDSLSKSSGDGFTTTYFVAMADTGTITCTSFSRDYPESYLIWPCNSIVFTGGPKYPEIERAVEYDDAEYVEFSKGDVVSVETNNEYHFYGGDHGVWHSVRVFAVDAQTAAPLIGSASKPAQPKQEESEPEVSEPETSEPEPTEPAPESSAPEAESEPETTDTPSGLLIMPNPQAQPAEQAATYQVLEGFSQWNGTGPATARIDADHTQFSKIVLNGDAVAPANYTVQAGSTAITLHESYLKTLGEGTYPFIAEFLDGASVEIPLVVGKTAQAASGGSMMIWVLLGAALVVIAVASLVLAQRKKKQAAPIQGER